MVDISGKKPGLRTAAAQGRIILKSATLQKISEGKIKKGDPLTVAKIAAIQAVKDTPRTIPLCHRIDVSGIEFEYSIEPDSVSIKVTVKAFARTGVEMEAITGVCAALCTIWDMVKYLEKDELGQYPETRITDIRVVEKVKSNN